MPRLIYLIALLVLVPALLATPVSAASPGHATSQGAKYAGKFESSVVIACRRTPANTKTCTRLLGDPYLVTLVNLVHINVDATGHFTYVAENVYTAHVPVATSTCDFNVEFKAFNGTCLFREVGRGLLKPPKQGSGLDFWVSALSQYFPGGPAVHSPKRLGPYPFDTGSSPKPSVVHTRDILGLKPGQAVPKGVYGEIVVTRP